MTPRSQARTAQLAILAVGLFGASSTWASRAHAQEGAAAEPHTREPDRRAVLFVEASEEVDAFARVYLYEVVAGRLRQHGIAVVPGDLAAEPTPTTDCLRENACRDALLLRLGAPLVLALRISGAGPTLSLLARRSDTAEPVELEATETELGSALVAALDALSPAALPCVVVLASELPHPDLAVDGAPVRLPALVAPGEHRARAASPGRAPWQGSLTCTGGRVLRFRVE